MELQELVDRILDHDLEAVAAPAEADYHAAWLARDIASDAEFMLAAHGGALADRLAWVFLAGYQATIRRCFPTLPREAGWAAFVNTEDRSGDFAGTTLSGARGHRVLSGWKGWVAGAGHLDRMLVSASQGRLPFIVVRPSDPGVRLEVGPARGYLSEMTQGRAHFEDAPVREDQVIEDDSTFAVFRASESAYVRAALAAFMLAQTRRLDGPPSLIGGALALLFASESILRLPLPSDAASVAFLGVAEQTTALAAAFEDLIRERDPALYELWNKDRRLITGAFAGVQSRADAVLERVAPLPA
ncbi:MAG: hypothetical protein IT299_12440 [Dehalococcoidia bacterium]|nr:hypothetical protein [Dehalococcoidia bacterium]